MANDTRSRNCVDFGSSQTEISSLTERVHNLAVIASHPIQYQAPWFRELATRVRLHVFYLHRATPEDQARAGFGVGFEWDTALLDGYEYTWLENRARQPGIDHFFGCNTPDLRRVFEGRGFDAVLVSGWNLLSYWQAVGAARHVGIPVLARGDSQLPTARSWPTRAVKRVLYPSMLRKFDAFLAVGTRNIEYLRHYGVPAERIFFVPHCVDNDFFAAAAAQARQANPRPRERFRIAQDRVVFLFAGKLVPKKRPLDFVRALDLANRTADRACGLVVGDGPLRVELERHVRANGTRCSFVGFLNQRGIGAAYACADALVLPSDAGETWGLVANEAMATGLPVLASDRVGCVPDLVDEGETGYAYPCGNVEALACAMTSIVRDAQLRAALSEGARRRVAAYSLSSSGAALATALDEVAARRALA